MNLVFSSAWRVRTVAAFSLVFSLICSGSVTGDEIVESGFLDDLRLTFGLGAGVAPQYEGANEVRPIPFIIGRARLGARYFVGTDETGIRADIVGSRFIEFGPTAGFRFARDSDIGDPVIALLPEVDNAIEVGAFLAFNFPFFLTNNKKDALTIDMSAVQDVAGGHNGFVIRGSLRYRGLVTEKIVMQIGPFVNYGSDDFNSAYYDVTALGAIASGLPQFDAGSGFKDVGLRFSGRYLITRHWNVNLAFAYRRSIGDAAESPIVDIQGNENTFFGGLAFAYSWGK
ncbi:MAG: MipA/OmpV family protein [Pseudomonadota bacterium]